MWTVREVEKITGVSVRALHHYDAIGLLKPRAVTDAGYRMYDEACLARLGQILLLRELEFPLRDIRQILDDPHYDRNAALSGQLEQLRLRKERLENLIAFVENIQKTGVYPMNFQVFDKKKLDDYAAEAKKRWGAGDTWREYEAKTADYSEQTRSALAQEMMLLFAGFGALRGRSAADAEVQAQVKKLQDFITEHYYTCTKPILSGLGELYRAEGELRDNIDRAGGGGTAQLAADAIAVYCR